MWKSKFKTIPYLGPILYHSTPSKEMQATWDTVSFWYVHGCVPVPWNSRDSENIYRLSDWLLIKQKEKSRNNLVYKERTGPSSL